ncbi:MAG: hypothetical protein JW969_08815 [Spirochaetales bacterium]|nr:hypothetical protein [Spirochaetales bacterium]
MIDNTATLKKTNPAFDLKKANEAIIQLFKQPQYPLTFNGTIIYLLHDFDLDDQKEVCVIGLDSEKQEYAKMKYISNFARLFHEDKKIFRFYLYILERDGNSFRQVKRLYIDEQCVFKSITKLILFKGSDKTVIIDVAFQTRLGSEHKFLIFRQPSLNPVSRFTYIETVSASASITDIDNNGTLDIVTFDRGMDEGLGYETFLTWYKWNGIKFREYKTVNIVRNLLAFLDKVKSHIVQGRFKELCEFAFNPSELAQYRRRKNYPSEVLFKAFNLSMFFDTKYISEQQALSGIKDVIFPEILDNPFHNRNDKGSYFRLSFRLMYRDEFSIIPEVLIYMPKNPFGKQEFFFSFK